MKKIKTLFAVIIISAITSAQAGKTPDFEKIGLHLKSVFKNAQYEMISESSIPGVYSVYIPSERGTQLIYWHDISETMIFGEMIDKNGNSITMIAIDKYNSELMKGIDTSNAIKIGSGKNIIVEFLDTECPYCVQYNEYIKTKKDVTRYIFLHNPMGDGHPNSDAQSIHVLCSKDHYQALEDVYHRRIAKEQLLTCDEGVSRLKKFGDVARQYKVSGTPTMMVNGALLSGFRKTQLESLIN